MEKTSSSLQSFLLICGVLAVIIYIGTDILAGKLWHSYNFMYQSRSELAAIGSPVRQIVLPLDIIYNILIIAFGLGIWRLTGSGLLSRIIAGLLIGHAVIGLTGIFFPRHLNETVKSFANTINTIFGAVSLFLILLAILFGAINYRNWFQFYSIGILLVFIILTIFGLYIAPRISSKPYITPVGLQERVMICGCLLFVIMLAIVKLSEKGK
jgi:hypothetical protein